MKRIQKNFSEESLQVMKHGSITENKAETHAIRNVTAHPLAKRVRPSLMASNIMGMVVWDLWGILSMDYMLHRAVAGDGCVLLLFRI